MFCLSCALSSRAAPHFRFFPHPLRRLVRSLRVCRSSSSAPHSSGVWSFRPRIVGWFRAFARGVPPHFPLSIMGNCCSSENMSAEEKQRRSAEKARNKALEVTLGRDNSADQQINKLLLLGAGESGKSTLFKQMIQIYGKGFPEAERKNFIPIIYNNIITSMKVLVQQCDSFAPVNEENLVHKKLIEDLKGDEEIDDGIATALHALWNDPGIRTTYDNRAAYQLTDSCAYFLDQLDVVCAPNYLPSEQDVLRSRVRTTGIVENGQAHMPKAV